MRTIEQIKEHIAECKQGMEDERDYMPSQDTEYNEGMLSGFAAGLKLIEQGKDSAGIVNTAEAKQRAYVSRGHDLEDAWQSGYIVALEWCGEKFDWDDQGNPVFPTDLLCPECECKLWKYDPDKEPVFCRECGGHWPSL